MNIVYIVLIYEAAREDFLYFLKPNSVEKVELKLLITIDC